MKAYLILLLIFFFCLFQGAFLPLNLVLLTVLLWAAFRPAKGNLSIVFFAGLFLDFARGNSLGLSSLLFIIYYLLFTLYSRRFNSGHPLFLAIFVFLADVGYSRLINGAFNWPATLIVSFFALVVGLVWHWLRGELGQEIIKLKEPR